ncbi:hypothetical protein JK217_15125 [Gluconobacter kondonii]|uniref:hypothetical protein n=1 Tax=Gluconobacter kondonii TaxID=941463 RepID=UPI001B8CE38C|nr:hypothetical protein [Gluconobacter kondonii]MBS1079022.1 hypothetical protein [Gluconobacter kondonii]
MMCPDHGAVDHVGGGVALHHFSQRFQHRVEHASCNETCARVVDIVGALSI